MATEKKPAAAKSAVKKSVSAVNAASTEKKAASKKPVGDTSKAVAVKKDNKPAVAKTVEKKPAVIKPAPEILKRPEAAKTPEAKKEVSAAKTSEAKKEVSAAKTPEVKKEVTETKPQQTKKVLFVCSEAFPFAGTGGLGEVMGSLPKAVNGKKAGFEASIILPLYEGFPAEFRKELEFICHINVPLAWRNQYCGLFKLNYNGTAYYFIDNEYYFKRPNLYGYYDDGERFAFLSRAVVELIPHLGFRPDILQVVLYVPRGIR